MYICEVCGRNCKKKIRYNGYTLCSKHMHQLHKYGKFLDNIQRTNTDLNDYIIKEDGVYFNLYNQKNEFIDTFVIDFEDIEKVKYHKWRKCYGHVVTGLPSKQEQLDLSHVVLGLTKEDLKTIVVDHIDCNPLNNRKSNLRICQQKNNVCNRSFMSNNAIGFIGISYSKNRDVYDPEIRIENKRCHLYRSKKLEEAVYSRYVAELLVFKEFTNEEEHKKKENFTKNLPQQTKDIIYKYVKNKLINKGLINEQ